MVSVITVSYNKAEMTIECINSILRSKYDDFRIILIDNNSKPQEYKALKEAFSDNQKISLIPNEKNTGYVGGVNQGMELAREMGSNFFLIMNNDTVLDENAMEELVRASERYDQKAIVSGKVYYFDKPDVIQHIGMVFSSQKYLRGTYPCRNEKDTGQCDEEVERDSLDDVFWLLPSQILNDVGFYSNYFFLYAEQGDFAQRARKKGYKLIYTPGAKIWHKVSMSSGGNPASLPVCYWRGKGLLIFHYRNMRRKYFLILLMNNLTRFCIQAFYLKGDKKERARALLKGYFAGIRWIFNKKPDTGYNPFLK